MTARRVAGGLAGIALLFVVANGLVIFVRVELGLKATTGLGRLFDLDREGSLPALFSTALFFLNSALLFLVSKMRSNDGDRISRRSWLMLSGLFFFLAIDESAAIHEMLVNVLRVQMNTTGLFHFAWVIPYGIGTALLTVYLVPWFRRNDARTQYLFAASAALFICGALGMEMINGRSASISGTTGLPYQLTTMLEEALEMSGLILFIYSLMELIQRKAGLTASLVIPSAVESDLPGAHLPE